VRSTEDGRVVVERFATLIACGTLEGVSVPAHPPLSSTVVLVLLLLVLAVFLQLRIVAKITITKMDKRIRLMGNDFINL
jgi:hypothetical protein